MSPVQSPAGTASQTGVAAVAGTATAHPTAPPEAAAAVAALMAALMAADAPRQMDDPAEMKKAIESTRALRQRLATLLTKETWREVDEGNLKEVIHGFHNNG